MKIKLYSLPFLDYEYINVIDFKNETDRTNFFNSKNSIEVDSNVKNDHIQTYITINTTLKTLSTYDYLSYYDADNKPLYFFIKSKEYNTANSSNLVIQLDVFTTFQFDVTFLPSFVDRCHVPRWNGSTPTNETVDEGFNFTNYIQYTTPDKIADIENNYIMTSTAPLGLIGTSTGGSGGSGNMKDGVMSANGFVFIKGYEAFSDYGLYLTNESFKTVGYGFTELHNLEGYNAHKPFPCTEKLASELFADLIITEFGKRIYAEIENNNLQTKISINMFDAMCSLAWNKGVYGFLGDAESPWQLIKNNPYDPSISDRWKTYKIKHSGTGEILEGLRLRRIAEVNIYFGSNYEFRSIIKYTDNGQNQGIPVNNGVVTENDGKGFIPPIFEFSNFPRPSATDSYGNNWVYPTVGRISAIFGTYPDSTDKHYGTDVANVEGTEIYPIGNGKIIDINTDENASLFGIYIKIEHDVNINGAPIYAYYAHLRAINDVSINQRVTPGSLIGFMGTTGNSSGNHLHIELRKTPYNMINDSFNFDVNAKVDDIIN